MIPEKEVKRRQRLVLFEYIKWKRATWYKNVEIAVELGVNKVISSWIFKQGVNYQIWYRTAKKIIDRLERLQLIKEQDVD